MGQKPSSSLKAKVKSLLQRKIVILSYEDWYMNKLHNYISHLPISNEKNQLVFKESIVYSGFDLQLLLLNHLCISQWQQYFKGAQGVILVYSSKEADNEKLREVEKTLSNASLQNIPMLVLFDSSKDNKVNEESLREVVKEQPKERNQKILNVNFDKNILDMKNGIDWLCGYI